MPRRCFFSTMLSPLLLVFSVLFPITSFAATQWQTISPHVEFLEQPSELRFYDSNQVLIKGQQCALMVDASGNFAAVESLIKQLKSTLKVPLCYLVASHYHDDHLLGMAILQHYYPDAQLVVHKQVATEFSSLQQAYTNKLDSYEKSIELSFQRLAEQPIAEQQNWRDKLNVAKQRLLRWRQYPLQKPAFSVSEPLTLELGNYPVMVSPHQAHSYGDLTLSVEDNGILIGADIVDWLPYPGHGNFANWITTLTQFSADQRIHTILPGHGSMLKRDDLHQPLRFLKAIQKHVINHPEQNLIQLQQSFNQQYSKDYESDKIAKKAYPMFLQAGLKRMMPSK